MPKKFDLAPWERWQRDKKHLSPATIRTRRSVLRAVEAALPVPLLEATTDQLEAALDTRDLSASSRDNYASHTASFYAWALEEGLLTLNPAAGLRRLQ